MPTVNKIVIQNKQNKTKCIKNAFQYKIRHTESFQFSHNEGKYQGCMI